MAVSYYDRVIEAVQNRKVVVDSNSMLLSWVYVQKIWWQIQQFKFNEESEIAILKDIQTLEDILPYCTEAPFETLSKTVSALKATIYHLIGQSQVSVEIANRLTRSLVDSNLGDYVLVSAMCVLITTQIHLIYQSKGWNCIYELQMDFEMLRLLSEIAPLFTVMIEMLLSKYPNVVPREKLLAFKSNIAPNQGYYPYRVFEWVHLPTKEEPKEDEPPNMEYQPLNKEYQPPNKEYQPPNEEYQPPNMEHQPNNKEYHSHEKEESEQSPKVLYQTDSLLENGLNDIFLNWTQHTNFIDRQILGNGF